MKEIKNLSDLRENVEESVVQKICTEYFMELVVKSNKFDEIEEIIDNGGTLKSIKEIIRCLIKIKLLLKIIQKQA